MKRPTPVTKTSKPVGLYLIELRKRVATTRSPRREFLGRLAAGLFATPLFRELVKRSK